MVGSLTANAARDKARRWLDLISKEIDPKIEEERLLAEAKRRQDATFGRVANDFLDPVPSSCRRCLAGDPVHRCRRLPRLWPATPLQICVTCSTGRLRRMNTRLLSCRSATLNRGADRDSRGASACFDQRQVAGGVERRRCDGLSVRRRFQVADPDRTAQKSGRRTAVVRNRFRRGRMAANTRTHKCGRRTASRWTRWPSIFCASYPLDQGRLRL
jgi:hypothetical protein